MNRAILTSKSFKNAFIITFASIITVIAVTVSAAYAAQSTVNLGTAAPFAILAGTPNITDAGNSSVIQGNVGLSPATGAGIGLLMCPGFRDNLLGRRHRPVAMSCDRRTANGDGQK